MSRGLFRKIIICSIMLTFFLVNFSFANTVLNFDDIYVSTYTVGAAAPKLAENYGGLSWSGGSNADYWGLLYESLYRTGYGNSNITFPSSANVIFNEGGDNYNYGAMTVKTSSNTPFNFEGAYFAPWTRNNTQRYYGATQVTITGYLNNTLIGSQVIPLNPGSLQWVEGTLNNIDRLDFSAQAGTDNGRYFLMDNFTYSVVPLPGALLLLGAGLVRLAAHVRSSS